MTVDKGSIVRLVDGSWDELYEVISKPTNGIYSEVEIKNIKTGEKTTIYTTKLRIMVRETLQNKRRIADSIGKKSKRK